MISYINQIPCQSKAYFPKNLLSSQSPIINASAFHVRFVNNAVNTLKQQLHVNKPDFKRNTHTLGTQIQPSHEKTNYLGLRTGLT